METKYYMGTCLFCFKVKELVGWVDNSNADFVILGGDFNTDPEDKETSYHNLKNSMVSSMEEFFLDIKVRHCLSKLHISYLSSTQEWLCPSRATYGNPKNTYSYMYAPVLYDYIWHRSNRWNMIWTNFFEVGKSIENMPSLSSTIGPFSENNERTR